MVEEIVETFEVKKEKVVESESQKRKIIIRPKITRRGRYVFAGNTVGPAS